MSKLIAFQAANFKGIELVRVEFDIAKGIFQVMGDNGSGKTSLLEAVQALFGGKEYDPEMVIRKGADGTEVLAEFDDLTVTGKWTNKTRRIIVESKPDGARYKSPQAVLEALWPSIAFDAEAFSDLSPAEQADMLRKLVGLDTTKIEAERKKIYDERTLVNRDVATLKAQFDAISVPPPVTDIGKEIDIAEVAQKKSAAITQNSVNAIARKAWKDAEETHKKASDDLARLEEAVAKQKKKVSDFFHVSAEAGRAAAAAVDIDLTELDTTINNANAANKIVQAKKNAQLDHLRVIKQKKDLEAKVLDQKAKSDGMTDQIETLDKKKAEALAACKFPVEGMSVDGDAVFVNGIPYCELNTEQQIRIGLAMSQASNPKLRATIIKSGDKIYPKKMEVIAKWADENNVLILMERAETKGAVGVVLEEGRVRDEPAADLVESVRVMAEEDKKAILSAPNGDFVRVGGPDVSEPTDDEPINNIPASVEDEIAQLMKDMQG